MCGNLVKKGNLTSPLVLYNRTGSRAKQLAEELGNCTVADSATEAVAQADVIFTCLTDDLAVLELFHQVLEKDVTGKLFVNCSTTQPATSDDLAAMVEKRGAEMVTMPGKYPFNLRERVPSLLIQIYYSVRRAEYGGERLAHLCTSRES